MALTLENKMIEYQKIIQENFKVQNPYLLKTGTLGTLANILAFQDIDAREYYNKVFQEMHPGLANDFLSMLFHASFYDVNVELASPATFSVHLQIPKINVNNLQYMEYNIPANTQFKDTLGYDFIIPEQIEIRVSSTKIVAYAHDLVNGKIKLNIIESTNEIGQPFYLIEYNNVKQYNRSFQKIIVPDYDFGTNFQFDININSYKELYKTRVWLNEDISNPIDTNQLYKFSDDGISQSFNLTPMDIKYYTFGSSKFDYDIFLDIKETVLSFRTGDGTFGKKLSEGQELIIEIENTKGSDGNFENIDFNIENVIVTETDLQGKVSAYKTIITGFSVSGGTGGESVEAVESIREKIFNQLKVRNSITTEADFETSFEINGIKPFVDSKFIDNKSIVFLFNTFKYNEEVIPTTSINMVETQLASDPFYPTVIYNNELLISPFYYKRMSNNVTQAYIVKPRIEIPLFNSSTADELVIIDNQPQLYIDYDFNLRKSFVTLENVNQGYTYKINTNQFSITLTYQDDYKWEVDKVYTDDYCVIKDYLYDFNIQIFDDNGNYVITLFNYKSEDTMYHQLKLKQEMYKYYIPVQPQNYNLTSSTEEATLNYLDNQLAEILSTVEELYEPISEGEKPYILRMPFISKDFFDNTDYLEFYSYLDDFFTLDKNKDKLSLTSKVQQCFYNTIDILPQYYDYIFKQKNIEIKNPKIPITINLNINKNNLILSDYESIYDLEFNIKLDIIQFLQSKEGFQVEFFESEVENEILLKYNQNVKLISNIELLSPKLFIVNDADSIYYSLLKDFDVNDLINFIPPYFYYDYQNIQIITTLT